ncbi:hypothetical protein HGRIS_014555 [Hohenbuehelia grisea]|uniref:DUF6535 domain-containing protein n=1 Tax=Hohenbuehelia grisea TaxID=104357 RepID=A0ABR3JVS9_9AGAR
MSSTPPGRNHSPSPSVGFFDGSQPTELQHSPLTSRDAEDALPNKALRAVSEETSSLTRTDPHEAVQTDASDRDPVSSSSRPHSRASSARRAAADRSTGSGAAPARAHSDRESTQSDDSEDNLPPAPGPETTSKRRAKPFGHTTFGLKAKHRPANQAGFIDPRDYENKYPEDPIYEELSENARVWRVYLDEAADFDADMVEKASDGLDLLLVFAGLFSAVLTTFVVQTSQSLSSDHAAISASLLLELVSIQRAMANGTSIASIPLTDTTSGPSRGDVWVNALWFTSLTLSLSTALLAVLVRQWLHQYTAITYGTSRDRSLIRQYRNDGLMKWRVTVIISVLPVLLHVALGLFLVGLVIFLAPLSLAVAWTVASITFLVYAAYTISNILPLVNSQCPYRTPFSDILHTIWLSALALWAPISRSFIRHDDSSEPQKWSTLKEIEGRTSNTEEVGFRAIEWLIHSTANPPTTRIALQSLGAFSPQLAVKRLHFQDLVEKRRTLMATEAMLSNIIQSPNYPQDDSEARFAERLSRSMISMISMISTIEHPLCWYGPFSDDPTDYWVAPICISPFIPSPLVRVHTAPHVVNFNSTQKSQEILDLFLNILDSSTNNFLFPPIYWETLSTAGVVKEDSSELSSALADSPDTLLRLYRLAFTSQPLPPKDMAFQPEVISAPKELLQRLAINAALRNEDDHIPAEKYPRALLNINNSLWSSIIDPTAPSTEELDPVAGAWSAIASNCHNMDISPGLSQELAKGAALILKTRLPHDHHIPAAIEEGLNGINAVCSLNGEFRSGIYTKVFLAQDFNTPGKADQSLLTSTDGGARFWTGALAANYQPAYRCFAELDILSKLHDPEDVVDAVRPRWPIFKWVLPAFIQGLARRPLSLALNSDLTYLFEPHNLFAACAGVYVVNTWESDTADTVEFIDTLVCLNPENPSWAERTFYRSKYDLIATSINIELLFDIVDAFLQAQKDIQLQSDSEQRPIGEPLGEPLVAKPQIAEQPQDAEQAIAGQRPFYTRVFKNLFRPCEKPAASIAMQIINTEDEGSLV